MLYTLKRHSLRAYPIYRGYAHLRSALSEPQELARVGPHPFESNSRVNPRYASLTCIPSALMSDVSKSFFDQKMANVVISGLLPLNYDSLLRSCDWKIPFDSSKVSHIVELDNILSEHGILLEDVVRRGSAFLQSADALSLDMIRGELYGSRDGVCMPIPVDGSISLDIGNTRARRQLLIERTTQRVALQDSLDFQEAAMKYTANPIGNKSGRALFLDWVRAVAAEVQRRSIKIGDLSSEVLAVVSCRCIVSTVCKPAKQTLKRKSKLHLDDSPGNSPYQIVCDAVGIALNAEINAKGGTTVWSPQERFQNGASLVDVFLARALVTVSFDVAATEVAEAIQTDQHGIISDQPYAEVSDSLLEPWQNIKDISDRPSKLFRSWPSPGALEPKRIPGGSVKIRAFVHRFAPCSDSDKLTGEIQLRKSLMHLFDSEEVLSADVDGHAKFSPLIIPTLPWKAFWSGGYLLHRAPIIKHTGSRKPCEDFQTSDFSRIASILDYLGSTPWRINQQVYKVMNQAWENNIEAPGFPGKHEVEPVDDSRAAKKRADDLNREMLSERSMFLLKQSVAKQFFHADRIFFPHNIDFRGRSYPIPPHLNHQGDDVSRGLLHFADPKPLGNRGLFWLRIQLANLFGHDKIPFPAREAWTIAQADKIDATSKDPLSGRDFWFAADDPWQALACILEIAEAQKLPDPSLYLSRVPVHQDGSCNGLQHYAALGRDSVGARAVNILPTGKVEDVYTHVLDIVKLKVNKKAASGDATAAMCIAHGVLQRRIVKQTVMTICYGVTRIGAGDQVRSAIEDFLGDAVDSKQALSMASLLAGLILNSINEIFSRAMTIKTFFDGSSRVLNSKGLSVNWMSPVGFPCRQPYRDTSMSHIVTSRQTLTMPNNSDKSPLSKAKQRLGFPPNFVHSLDAAHLCMTAERCRTKGLVFAGVHDSYWTHAASIDVMSRELREAFVDLHSQPILEDLRKSFEIQLGPDAHRLPPLPPQGDLDLLQVLGSPFFFD